MLILGRLHMQVKYFLNSASTRSLKWYMYYKLTFQSLKSLEHWNTKTLCPPPWPCAQHQGYDEKVLYLINNKICGRTFGDSVRSIYINCKEERHVKLGGADQDKDKVKKVSARTSLLSPTCHYHVTAYNQWALRGIHMREKSASLLLHSYITQPSAPLSSLWGWGSVVCLRSTKGPLSRGKSSTQPSSAQLLGSSTWCWCFWGEWGGSPDMTLRISSPIIPARSPWKILIEDPPYGLRSCQTVQDIAHFGTCATVSAETTHHLASFTNWT